MKDLLIIAGHGQGDPGACGCGLQEATETRRVAQALYNLLNGKISVDLYPFDRDMYQTRDFDSWMDYRQVIEVHLNAAGTTARGTEVLVLGGYSTDALDQALLDAMATIFISRGFKPQNNLANMNEYAHRGINYRLIEVCFISNQADVDTYVQHFNTLISNMSDGILRYYGVQAAKWVWDTRKKAWWYDYGDGTYPKDGWKSIDGDWYYFDKDGWAYANKWIQYKGKWFYLLGNCKMAKGWNFINGEWYYLSKKAEAGFMEGEMYENKWFQDLASPTKDWYRLGVDGKMIKNSFFTVDGFDYYAIDNGRIILGWQFLPYLNRKKEWFYFAEKANVYNKTPKYGMVRGEWVKYGDQKSCYLQSDGVMARNKVLSIGGRKYSFNNSGYATEIS